MGERLCLVSFFISQSKQTNRLVKMRSILAIFCVWICFGVDASTPNGCSKIPEVENAEVSQSSRKDNYTDGDKLEYNCKTGYASLLKITFKCTDNKWTKLRDGKCSLKRCELPEDIPNGRYIIVSGRNFVFGTTIKYICKDDYQMVSRFDTRTCREGGWDNQLPACEEVSCVPDNTEENVRVEGLPDNEGLIRYGHRLTFSCIDYGWVLQGPKEITCQLNGQWSGPFPKCEGATCPLNTTVEDVKMERSPDIVGPIKPRHKLIFSCNGQGLKLKGAREITCLTNGEWSSPFPKCEEVTCEGEQLLNVDVLMGHPGIVSPYKPGHILVFRCTDVNLKMYGQRAIECLSNGKWDNPYPKCGEVSCVPNNTEENVRVEGLPDNEGLIRYGHRLTFSCIDYGWVLQGPKEITCQSNGQWSGPFPKCVEATCPLNTTVEDVKMERIPDIVGPVKPRHKLIISCNGQGLKLKGVREITCLTNGEWSSPFPKCEEVMCVANLTVNMRSDEHPGPEISVRSGDTITLSCVGNGVKLQGHRKITCLSDGQWDVPFPKCIGGKCGPPPHVNFADTTEMTKKEYNSGERVEYTCFNKYILVQRYPYSKYLTCEDGEWRGNIKCLKPCSVSLELMDERGIQLRWGEQRKIFSPHGDRIQFRCQSGKSSIGSDLTQTCNDGVMNLPLCE
ncbi:sushi, von Willebrand factor type A, EGF and pentraxin domain-containing protein 1-like [Megalobrama amblycephala]|uniref:sushi, von Willebrand factor type A, EGF and pentraxin domain-containing protein 1-like n=1 Tax=Megalobrama amblycephala TaxID=75352 RepID=UPI00201462D9|nr:sushi, von Willebrand factor type A, EGF and pentraxin domain-containing protein 1-like [Megalobrama amblycephala]